MTVEIAVSQESGKLVLVLEGRLDGTTTDGFVQEARRAFGEAKGVYVLDFSGVPYLSSAGLRGILIIAKEIKQAGGKLAICAPTAMVREVFELARMSGLIPIFATRNEAVGNE